MRFMLYNIRYGTGGKRRHFPFGGYLAHTAETLDLIAAFIRSLEPDIVGLVEVDAGSYRSHRRNQAKVLAEGLGHYHTYASKYRSRLARSLPILSKQGNAFLSRDTVSRAHFHYFTKGVKRLCIELETEAVTVFLVHLALTFKTRQHQLNDLYTLVKRTRKPHIVAGDFNATWGEREIRLFLAATGLTNADPAGQPSFPSWKPKRHLDFVLHCPRIRTTGFQVPRVRYSDHLPLVCDFELR
jgi:endonuclease/exonuclease/phosphatase family metal-dependent hydrolase